MMTIRRWSALPLVMLCGLGLGACGSSGGGGDASSSASSRTPDAYCEAFYSRASPLHDEYAAAGSADDFTTMLDAVTAPGRLATVFAEMARHAPDDMITDTNAVRDAFQNVQDSVGGSASNPLSAIVKGTIAGAAANDSLDRVGKYLEAHCPLDSSIARKYVKPNASSSPSTSTTTNAAKDP